MTIFRPREAADCLSSGRVPTLMRLPDALRTMAQERAQLLCVLDEYGGFAGVVTAEDLAEEIVGEIEDEQIGRAHV